MTDRKRCGQPAFGFKLTCDLECGHVKTEDDWHEAVASTTQVTADYDWRTTETVRWAPKSFELPREQS